MLKQYLRSIHFNQYLLDWVTVVVLLYVFFGIVEPAKPFFRQFKLSDTTLQHPFATSERVSDNQLYVISAIVPTLFIFVVKLFTFSLKGPNSNSNNKVLWYHKLHLSILGLWVSLLLNGVFTDILKNLIGRPRPDFLDRCAPFEGTPYDEYVDITVCSSPLGIAYLLDGMKSTPLGHSLISFSGLFYLSLWLINEIREETNLKFIPIIWYLLSILPSLLASYIALSRTQDYRHHFIDIILGTLIGITISSLSYFRYKLELRSISQSIRNN